MTKINSQGPQVSHDADKARREEALADVKKGTAQKVEEAKTEQVDSGKKSDVKTDTKKSEVIKDGFAGKADTNKFGGTKAELEKAAAQFKQDFPDDVVQFLEKNLKTQFDPAKVMKLKNQVSNDPAAKQVVQSFKIALEEGAQKVLQKRSDEAKKASETDPSQKPSETPGKLELRKQETTQRVGELAKDVQAKDLKKADQSADAKKGDATKDAKADDKKADKTDPAEKKDPTDPSQTDPKTDPADEQPALDGENPVADGAATAEDGGVDIPDDDIPDLDTGGPATGDSSADDANPTLDDGTPAVGNSGGSEPPEWQGGSDAQLSGAETTAIIQFRTWLENAGTGSVGDFALIVLMQAVGDVDKDMAATLKLLKMRHAVSDAMRSHYEMFMHQMAGLDGKEAREWQHMKFDIGYDEAGNMIVQSYPDLSWQTAAYEDVPGKGADDMSPEESFVSAHGQDGIDEARQNGTLHHIDGDHVSGLTSYSMVRGDTVQLEKDRMRSKMSELKDETQKVTLQVQRAMDMRKNLLEQFSKIYDSRSDNWDQNIAMMLR